MKIEHIGFCVAEPIKMGKWYHEHLGMEILRTLGTDKDGAVFIHDAKSGFVLEIFSSPDAGVLEFSNMHPITFHLAIDCQIPLSLGKELEKAGAKIIDGSHIIDPDSDKLLVKDPWGLTLQLINRNKKLIKPEFSAENENISIQAG